MSVVDGKVWLILAALTAALAVCARLVYLSSRRIASADVVEQIVTIPAAPAVVPLRMGPVVYPCTLCGRTVEARPESPAEYVQLLTDPNPRWCGACTAELDALGPDQEATT